MSNPVHELMIPEAGTLHHFFKGQLVHVAALGMLLFGAHYLASRTLGDGFVWGISDRAWFWLGVSVAIVHQVFVWVVWRAQLGWGLWTKWFGNRDITVFGAVFFPLILTRPLIVIVLGISDFGSLQWPTRAYILTGVVFLLPGIYTIWSVFNYFGVLRALGGDHFRKRFQEKPLVTEGIFRWCSNAMYAFGFCLLWALAFFANSVAALSLVFFQHAYVWVHYFCTEKPDMELIYGSSGFR